MSAQILSGLSCPSCGGEIEVTEGKRLAHCKYCDAVLMITSDDAGVSRMMYRMNLNGAEAEKAARKWFGVFPKARDLAKNAVITESFPIYVPFWRLSGTGKAIVCGSFVHKDKNGGESVSHHENISEGEYLWSVIACQTGDLGISTQPQPAEKLLPYTDGEIPVFDTTLSRDEAFDQADTDIRMEVYKKAHTGIDNRTFARTFCIPHDFSLLYYPYWIVRYSYHNLDYFVVFDGVTKSPVSGRAPGDKTYQSIAAGLGAGFGGLISGISVAYAALSGSELGLMALSGVIVGVILVLLGYWVFRFGSEITEGKLTGGISLSKNAFGKKTVVEVSS